MTGPERATGDGDGDGDGGSGSGEGGPGDERLRIAASGTRQHPHAHFAPVVEAELSWGNSVVRDWHLMDPKIGGWQLELARPFHVELLRETFRFPPNFALHVIGAEGPLPLPRMSLGDKCFMAVVAPAPKGWRAGNQEIPL
ncbi:hypothetical protein [Streptomyces sp. NPDC059009]|uniref:hypothetical protein n=1 Tax=Streptomyces sp. NPDC059009 TaxID=3346694 RepID=UPI0036D1D4B3